jgi:hypothetical protein
METPLVGMRMVAKHEDRQITKSLRTCLVESESGLFVLLLQDLLQSCSRGGGRGEESGGHVL